MTTRHNRWMTWVLEEAARGTPPLPFARGKQRTMTTARRATAATVPQRQTSAPLQNHTRG